MLTGQGFARKKLVLVVAFAALIAVAIGAGCNGFFVDPTLTSITINPSSPSVQLGQTITLTAFGLNSNNQGSNLTSGVSWSTSDPEVATITGDGSATLTGVSLGTATITAGAQSVTNTATATVFITISSMSISPTAQSMGENNTSNVFIVKANGSTDISSGAVLNVFQSGTTVSTISCSYSSTGSGGAGQYCTSFAATPGSYQVVASYTGTTLTATATLTITS